MHEHCVGLIFKSLPINPCTCFTRWSTSWKEKIDAIYAYDNLGFLISRQSTVRQDLTRHWSTLKTKRHNSKWFTRVEKTVLWMSFVAKRPCQYPARTENIRPKQLNISLVAFLLHAFLTVLLNWSSIDGEHLLTLWRTTPADNISGLFGLIQLRVIVTKRYMKFFSDLPQ